MKRMIMNDDWWRDSLNPKEVEVAELNRALATGYEIPSNVASALRIESLESSLVDQMQNIEVWKELISKGFKFELQKPEKKMAIMCPKRFRLIRIKEGEEIENERRFA
jgi:hypothetical protein